MTDYNWYPGHMTKARRMMEEDIRLVDLVIELADARIPIASRNPDIDTIAGNKPRILVLTRNDLADPKRTEEFSSYYMKKGIRVIPVDARTKGANARIKEQMRTLCAEKIARDRRRGIVSRPLRAMVVGVPNVGKSTFINSFVGRASAKTGNKPGVTKGKQWIRMDKDLELLDTPGILWPKQEDRKTGILLALTGCIREELLDPQELSGWLTAYMEQEYPGVLMEKYGGTDAASIAEAKKLMEKGGEIDIARAQKLILGDFKNGRTGRITLERADI